ncbi:MAG TPA: MlaD family protein [Baekduia sp.]|nr:MlaD family protein [Baekduia sp.]
MRQSLNHAAKRTEAHPVALGLISLALILLMTYIGFKALNGVPFQNRYRLNAVLPPDSPPLKDGDMVRVAGQRAGTIRSVTVGDGGLLVGMELTPSNAPVGRDARAEVRQRSVGGVYYVDITRGAYERRPLPEGATLPRQQTSTGGDLLTAVERFDRVSLEAMGRTVSAFGTGLTGRGEDLNRGLADLRPALEHAIPILDAATPRPGRFAALLRELRRTGRNLAPPGQHDLRALVPAASDTFEALSAAAPSLRRTIEELRPFEDEALRTLPVADPVLSQTAVLARELRPGVAALDDALPELNGLLRSGSTLERESGRLTRGALPTLAAGPPLFTQLRRTLPLLTPFARPVESIAAHVAPYDREAFVLGDSLIRGTAQVPAPGTDLGTNKGQQVQRLHYVFTCQRARNPYPAPGGDAADDKKFCPPVGP